MIVVLDFVRNIAILLALSMVYAVLFEVRTRQTPSGRCLFGFILGLAAIAGMLSPITIQAGLFVDGRTICVSLAGLLGGWIAVSIAVLMAVVCRAVLGGTGAVVGSLLIVSSGLIGVGYSHWCTQNKPRIRSLDFFILGLIVHFVMLGLMIFLPADVRWGVLRVAILPVIVVYPAGTVLVGRLFLLQDERTLARQAVQGSEAFLSKILQAAPAGIGILKERVFVQVNRYLCEITGYREDELLGKTTKMLYLNEDRFYEVGVQKDRMLQTMGAATIETQWRRKDGGIIYVVLSTISSLEEQQKSGILFTVIDITERKRVEDALRASEKNLHEAQKMARLGSWRWDLTTGAMQWSDEVFEIFQLDSTAFVPTVDFLMERSPWRAESDRIHKMIDEVSRTHEQGAYQQRVLRPDLSSGYYSSTFRGVYDETDTLVAIEGTVQDITESRMAEDALRDSSQRLALHVAQTPLAVIGWSPDFKVTEWNPAAERIFGYTREEALGKEALFFVPETSRAAVKKVWHQIISNEGGRFSANENVTRGGRIILCEWTNTPLIDEDGKVVGAASFVMDVTRRRKTEEAIRVLAGLHSAGSGSVFFEKVTRELSRILQADCAIVGGYRSGRIGQVDSLGFCLDGVIAENISYELAGCPCEKVAERGVCVFSEGVAELFPAAPMLKKMGFKSYVGVPLIGPSGADLGLLSVLFRRPLEDTEFVVSILQIFSGRVGGEIERCRADQKIEQLSRFPAENPNIVMRISAEGQVLYANQSSEGLLQYWGVAVGQNFPENLHDICTDSLSSGQAVGREFACGEFIYTLNFVPVLSERYVDVYGQDITSGKRAEEDRERLFVAIEQTAEIIVITDSNATIQYVNSAFETITGYSRQEVVGRNPRILQSGQHSVAFYKEMWDTLTAGKVWSGQLVNRKKDNTVYAEEATISPVLGRDGKVVNYVAAKRDVTRELALEGQLRQAQKMEAVGQMAGGIAHDFNNLLQVVSGYAELLEMKLAADDSLVVAVKEIGKASRRGKDLVCQLLAFSRRQVINPEDLDLNETIRALLDMIRGWIGEHIELELIAGAGLGVVHADCGMIEQVLMNLCVNARDAMPDGGTLTIKTENIQIDDRFVRKNNWATPGGYVLLSVTDTGSGMDGYTTDRIFEPFFTTKDVGKGTGLGLSMAFGIIKQHKGHIAALSEVGKGTVFRIYLPVVDRQPAAVSDVVSLPVCGGTETLLLAEDNEAVLNFAQQTLSEEGYTVLTAHDGEEAVRIFEENADRIDLIMMDVVMPRMGGKEAMDRILGLRPGVRYFFSSGYNDDATHTNFIQDRGMHLLSKPYKTRQLLQKVRELLDAPAE